MESNDSTAHAAICQAVTLMNVGEKRQASAILREFLANYVPPAAQRDEPAAVAALRELVSCKDLKEQYERIPSRSTVGWTGSDYERRNMLQGEYERRQPLAWEAARRVLEGKALPVLPDVQKDEK